VCPLRRAPTFRLVQLRGADGQVLLDLLGMPLPDPDIPAPVRFLPPRDNLLSHRDRTRVLSEEYRPKVTWSGGRVQPTFLVDGLVAGLWRWESTGRRALLVVQPFHPLPQAVVVFRP
ncbi:MAG: winged helix DNA-binding domain-containing protein, partial [Firmicutes bacterium]|nr:winged helix DNA-binding domain-containing protein [Bacillota bacterium]